MPKNEHRTLYNINEIQFMKSDEHHLSANEHFLLQLLQDTITEIQELKMRIASLEEKYERNM